MKVRKIYPDPNLDIFRDYNRIWAEVVEPDSKEWGDNEILLLCDLLLEVSLKDLAKRSTSLITKLELLSWIASDSKIGFSFINCCAATGFDSERLRSSVLSYKAQILH